MSDKVVISLATGLEDPERVTVAFLVAGAATAKGKQVALERLFEQYAERRASNDLQLLSRQERGDSGFVRSAVARASNYLTEHPEAATASDSAATAVREDGLRFPSKDHGFAYRRHGRVGRRRPLGPTPGSLLRAALAACDATLLAMEAARGGVELTDLGEHGG
jgi:hypothetical protein